MKKNYRWQGKRVKTEHGYCTVYQNKDKPLYWYNYDCHESVSSGFALIPAIKIYYCDHSFCIANHFGIGHHKLINGGWPNYTHSSLPVESFTKSSKKIYKWDTFDLEMWEQYNIASDRWFKENYPKEFEELENLTKSLKCLLAYR